MSEPWPTASSSPEATPAATLPATNLKRNATTAGINTAASTNFRAVKRRASKACQCCRARKVRCNVVEHGAPCTNCRLDEVECVITESKRRKKFWGSKVEAAAPCKDSHSTSVAPGGTGNCANNSNTEISTSTIAVNSLPAKIAVPIRRESMSIPRAVPPHSPEVLSLEMESPDIIRGSHVPHFIYQHAQSHLGEAELDELSGRPSYATSNGSAPSLCYTASAPSSTASSYPKPMSTRPSRTYDLPSFIKPTPSRLPTEDLEFLSRKGALMIPEENLRNELLKAHFRYVHPFMPLLNRKEFLQIVTGVASPRRKIGLLLFQAVMFTGSAFVDMELLRAAGYTTRKAARKAFFTKARLLYDFDHEPDRMTLVQSLLLMTYWYETPDDQKDTWHWMGVAISLSHTIGLHRNPDKSLALDSKRKKLWKRIWWSCVMRDRLVALGMRRPTRIKSEDCDVPMLTLEDFEIDMDLSGIPIFTDGTSFDQEMMKQRELAVMCIEKAKLCVCISHVLTAQYSVLNTNQGGLAADGSTKATMVLLPKGEGKDTCEVEKCDAELQAWIEGLSEEAMYRPVRIGDEPMDESLGLHRNLLHMVYFTTVSALHRPQVLPSAPAPWPARNANAALQERSRCKVRQAASEITRLATELIDLNLVRYMPTTGVTVMLPAIIIHLLDIKSSNPLTRERSVEGFSVCMQIMQGLRVSYASADYATHFLEAAIKKADIQVANSRRWAQAIRKPVSPTMRRRRPSAQSNPPPSNMNVTQSSQSSTLTPPPDHVKITTEKPSSPHTTTPPPVANITVPYSPTVVSAPTLTNLEKLVNTNTGASTEEEATLALKLESFLATTPPPPSSTNGSHHHDDCAMLDSPDISSATTPPPISISIPRGDDDYYTSPTSNTQDHDSSSIDAILGKDIDPFLGHYEEGAELSLRGNGNMKFGSYDSNSSWGGFNDVMSAGVANGNTHGNASGFGGAGGWMEGGVDMECVGRLLDGMDFDLDDVIQVFEG